MSPQGTGQATLRHTRALPTQMVVAPARHQLQSCNGQRCIRQGRDAIENTHPSRISLESGSQQILGHGAYDNANEPTTPTCWQPDPPSAKSAHCQDRRLCNAEACPQRTKEPPSGPGPRHYPARRASSRVHCVVWFGIAYRSPPERGHPPQNLRLHQPPWHKALVALDGVAPLLQEAVEYHNRFIAVHTGDGRRHDDVLSSNVKRIHRVPHRQHPRAGWNRGGHRLSGSTVAWMPTDIVFVSCTAICAPFQTSGASGS